MIPRVPPAPIQAGKRRSYICPISHSGLIVLVYQLAEIVLENGSDVFGIPMELKKDLLLNLHEASTSIEPPEDWEGAAPDQLLLQMASAWGIEIQQFEK